ncbi:OB-fold domain-containing protein [Sphingomonas sp. 1P06PA]|uniref:Zn-ribbon domain-containing OB-fold protein n=1 Tax=Sphingomonas sp. 1P06PA TaxID=554121 RepID=UPI0039A718A3
MIAPMPVVPVNHPRRYPPRVTAFTQPFWTSLASGRFLVTRCSACERASFPPKPICPYCWTETSIWEQIATRGTLYSWTRIHAGPAIFEADLPYPVGIVDLDGGIRIACPLQGEADWRCGQEVELIVRQYADGPFYAAREIQASTM